MCPYVVLRIDAHAHPKPLVSLLVPQLEPLTSLNSAALHNTSRAISDRPTGSWKRGGAYGTAGTSPVLCILSPAGVCPTPLSFSSA